MPILNSKAVLNLVRRFFRYLLRVFIGLVSAIVLYLAFAYVFSIIPVHKNFKDAADGIDVYLFTNGVHTDIVLPVHSQYHNWAGEFASNAILYTGADVNYVAFGWGDKGFYLNTPEWSDLTFGTAFKAVFGLGGSAVHVTFYSLMTPGKHCKKLTLNKDQFSRLCSYIAGSFKTDEQGNFMLIPNAGYDFNDCFYEARGRYNLFFTCNTWVNRGLKHAGPFSRAYFTSTGSIEWRLKIVRYGNKVKIKQIQSCTKVYPVKIRF